jgi:putative transposase
MPRKRFTAEQIITKLREAEVLLSRGQAIAEVCRELDISENTYYRWRKEYGGLDVDQARRLKQLEKENVRLKKLVADQAPVCLPFNPSAMQYVQLFLFEHYINRMLFLILRTFISERMIGGLHHRYFRRAA